MGKSFQINIKSQSTPGTIDIPQTKASQIEYASTHQINVLNKYMRRLDNIDSKKNDDNKSKVLKKSSDKSKLVDTDLDIDFEFDDLFNFDDVDNDKANTLEPICIGEHKFFNYKTGD